MPAVHMLSFRTIGTPVNGPPSPEAILPSALPRLRQGGLGRHRDERRDACLDAADAVQHGLGELDGGHLAAREQG